MDNARIEQAIRRLQTSVAVLATGFHRFSAASVRWSAHSIRVLAEELEATVAIELARRIRRRKR